MNLLIINLDKAIFSKDSASLARLKEYSQLVNKMFVIVWTKKKEKPISYNNKLFIYPTNSTNRLNYFLNSFKLAKDILKSNQIDLLFTQDPFETGLCGWLIAKKNKLKWQTQIHTDVFSPYFYKQSLANKIRVILAKFLIKRADSIRVVSQRIKRSLVNLKISQAKIFVLPIFADVNKLAKAEATISLKEKYPQFNFIILMASRLSPEKNIGLAIDAVSSILKTYSSAGLVIIGSGREANNLKSKIKKLKLYNKIILEPWTNDLASYYKSADLFLQTSNYEGWGMAIVEAMALGCPVIMTDVGCAGELVINGQSGLVIPVGDKIKLAEAIIKIMSDEKLKQEIILNAADDVKQLLSKEKYLAEYKKSWLTALD